MSEPKSPAIAVPAPKGRRTRSHLARMFPPFIRPTALYRFFTDKRASRGSKLLLLFALAYVVWPIDLIPDAAPLIGWLDDVGLATAVLGWVAIKISRHEHAREALADVGVESLNTSD